METEILVSLDVLTSDTATTEALIAIHAELLKQNHFQREITFAAVQVGQMLPFVVGLLTLFIWLAVKKRGSVA